MNQSNIDDAEDLNENSYIDPEEIGTEDEEDINQDENTFNQAVIWGTDWTAETVNNQLVRNNIDLFPKFQRRDAWSNVQKSRFIESLMLGLPIPQIILAEKKGAKGKYIVIDGKQRLLTLRRFFSESSSNEFKPLRLSGLEILKKLNGKTYKRMGNSSEFSNELNQIENQSIRTVVIKNWPNEEFLFTVFLRLNTGSIKLSPQELRQALHPGPFIDFADEFSIASDEIRKMLNLTKPDYRMRDVEIVIRYFAYKYYLKQYDGNLKKAFDNTVQSLNDEWDEKQQSIINDAEQLNKAIEFTASLFGGYKKAFSKWVGTSFQENFNRAIFDIMVYYFSDPKIREEAASKSKEVVTAFMSLCEDDVDFLSSFEHTTKSLDNTFKRFTTWGETLAEILNHKISVPYLEDRTFSLKKI